MNTTLIITITVLALIVLLFLLADSPSRRISTSRKAELYQDFARIYSNAVSDDLSARRDSFIKMDNILTKALQVYFSNRETCGTNLKLAKKKFSKKQYERIWEVHKMRNAVVHDDLEVSKEESVKAFEVYKMSLVTLLR
jgi:hypothetical protein